MHRSKSYYYVTGNGFFDRTQKDQFHPAQCQNDATGIREATKIGSGPCHRWKVNGPALLFLTYSVLFVRALSHFVKSFS